MKNFKYIITVVCSLVAMTSCIEDLSQYEYKQTNKVTFDSFLDHDYTWTSGEEVELTAPLTFSQPYENEADIDKDFEITWYANAEVIAQGYRIKYVVDKIGAFSIVLKVVNRTTGETYVSDIFRSNAKSSFGWGWVVLSERDNEASSMSFISPLGLFATHNLENNIPDGLGTGPKNIYHYYVLGSIPDVYISGLSKVIVNQKSGTVTLDGDSFQKDKWMRDEFASGSEPVEDFTMAGFAWKETYYLIYTPEGDIYQRCMTHDYAGVPYYSTYSSTPVAFDGGAKIGCFNSFKNVSYLVPNESVTMLYDELNARFLAVTRGGYGDTYDEYSPKVIYLNFYDQEGEFDPSVPKVNNLGAGTKCLAIGAYEFTGVTESGGYNSFPKYVTLIDLGGSKNYQIYRFSVTPMSATNHVITENTMVPFTGGSLMTDDSKVLMSTDFEKNPFFYFTDGDKKLYVYSMEAGTHVLAYEATSKITGLSSSSLACPFSAYGANSTAANFRLALTQEGGTVSVLDVAEAKMVKLFEGQKPDLLLKSISGFGDIKDIEWVTNYEGEF